MFDIQQVKYRFCCQMLKLQIGVFFLKNNAYNIWKVTLFLLSL